MLEDRSREQVDRERIGVYGGAFNPVHFGHLLLAEQCREQCSLDRVLLCPTSDPPHRDASELLPGPVRAELLDLAIQGIPGLQVSRCELEREGKSYTVDTLEELKTEYPQADFFLLLAEAWLPKLGTWRAFERIAELAKIVAVNRAGVATAPPESLVGVLPEIVRQRIQYVPMPGMDISSTDLRARLMEGRSIRFLTPRAVVETIERLALYRKVVS